MTEALKGELNKIRQKAIDDCIAECVKMEDIYLEMEACANEEYDDDRSYEASQRRIGVEKCIKRLKALKEKS